MPDEDVTGGPEEIQGAPAPAASLLDRCSDDTVELPRQLHRQYQQFLLMLLGAQPLRKLLDVLLISMPRHFGFRAAELWLHDPDGVVAELVPLGHGYGQRLQLQNHVFDMQELYAPEPDVAIIDASEPRMFEVLKADPGINQSLLLPLTESGRLVGSLHCGVEDMECAMTEVESELWAHLAIVISICYRNSVNADRMSAISVLDPLTRISNPRGFEVDLAREVARAQRGETPVSLLLLDIDEYLDIDTHYGRASGDFVLKKVTERVSSDLRATDHLARLEGGQLAVILPGCGEVRAQEIAERMRGDTEDLPIDDGRGAVLQVTLSIGLVTWEPQRYPAPQLQRLAEQMRDCAGQALQRARSDSGNRVTTGHLNQPLV